MTFQVFILDKNDANENINTRCILNCFSERTSGLEQKFLMSRVVYESKLMTDYYEPSTVTVSLTVRSVYCNSDGVICFLSVTVRSAPFFVMLCFKRALMLNIFFLICRSPK